MCVCVKMIAIIGQKLVSTKNSFPLWSVYKSVNYLCRLKKIWWFKSGNVRPLMSNNFYFLSEVEKEVKIGSGGMLPRKSKCKVEGL